MLANNTALFFWENARVLERGSHVPRTKVVLSTRNIGAPRHSRYSFCPKSGSFSLETDPKNTVIRSYVRVHDHFSILYLCLARIQTFAKTSETVR